MVSKLTDVINPSVQKNERTSGYIQQVKRILCYQGTVPIGRSDDVAVHPA